MQRGPRFVEPPISWTTGNGRFFAWLEILGSDATLLCGPGRRRYSLAVAVLTGDRREFSFEKGVASPYPAKILRAQVFLLRNGVCERFVGSFYI